MTDPIVRRRWRVEFETGAVEFSSTIDDEAFIRSWARKAKGVPRNERITKVTWAEVTKEIRWQTTKT